MSVHFVSLKGERTSNEDQHNIVLNMNSNEDVAKINFYGVYDGHGGKFVSEFLSANLPQFFTSSKVSYPLNVNYVNNVYDEIQKVLYTKHVDKSTECGSTCLVVCHYKENESEHINVINTGDSRCVLCRNNIGIALTKDHKPDWPDEENRIMHLGGIIRQDKYGTYRINDLSVSRAFGDKSSEKFVTHRPDIYKYTLTKKDKFIIIACDGLWDVLSSQDAVNIVLKNCYDLDKRRINKRLNIARILAKTAIDRDCGDNVTCIVVFFEYDSNEHYDRPNPQLTKLKLPSVD